MPFGSKDGQDVTIDEYIDILILMYRLLSFDIFSANNKELRQLPKTDKGLA